MPRRGYRKPAAEARSITIRTYLTPLEKNQLIQNVQRSDVLGVAEYIRELILGHEIKRRPPNSRAKLIDGLATLNRKLASIDNNMNQLARIANSGGRVSEIHLQQTLDEHKRLKALAAEVLQQIAGR